jgi:LacI family transcriptional regulator
MDCSFSFHCPDLFLYFTYARNCMAEQITQKDVARALGIAQATVSMALRNDPRITLSRREEIQLAASRMGYRPNPMAAALGQLRSTKKAHAVVAELAWINHSENPHSIRNFKEFNLYWKGAQETAEFFAYNLEEYVCNSDFTLERLAQVLSARGVHGILIPPHSKLPPNWDDFPWDKFSAVRFGYCVPSPQVNIVTSDQLSNSLLAFSKIRLLGYRRIGFVTGFHSSTWHRAGFLVAQADFKPGNQVQPLILDSKNRKQTQKVFLNWLKKNKPDAILTDVSAVREMLETGGYHVPDDMGLAVFSVLDGNADAGIYQNPEYIGKAAVEMLISLINHHYTGIPEICRELLIKGKWVDGSSLPPCSKL